MEPEELHPGGWIGADGTFTFAPSVTGYGHSWVPVPVAVDGDRLIVALTCPREAS
jgi:hypothetical protein